MSDPHATGSRAATAVWRGGEPTQNEINWACDLIDVIDPGSRFSPVEFNVAVNVAIAAKRKAEYERASS